MTETATRTYSVEGMTCEHCRAAVSEEVGAVEGVERVDVDLASGRLQVSGAGVSDQAVAAAVEEAGYKLRDGAPGGGQPTNRRP